MNRIFKNSVIIISVFFASGVYMSRADEDMQRVTIRKSYAWHMDYANRLLGEGEPLKEVSQQLKQKKQPKPLLGDLMASSSKMLEMNNNQKKRISTSASLKTSKPYTSISPPKKPQVKSTYASISPPTWAKGKITKIAIKEHPIKTKAKLLLEPVKEIEIENEPVPSTQIKPIGINKILSESEKALSKKSTSIKAVGAIAPPVEKIYAPWDHSETEFNLTPEMESIFGSQTN